MPNAHVLRLDEYRNRRSRRLARSRAFVAHDPVRRALFDHLVEFADLCGSERVGAVWVDEYGSGLVHPWLVVDSLADRPRRAFAIEPLQRAWERGVPGVYDDAAGVATPLGGTVSVALGSDGARTWFLVADSATRRRALDEAARWRLAFLAGECSALVLHRDLEGEDRSDDRPTFEGWQILEDLDGVGDDDPAVDEVRARFAVGRLARLLVEDDLVVPDERRTEQVGAARAELEELAPVRSGERPLLDAVLEALAAGDLEGLTGHLLALGSSAERRDHAWGALELYECAFEIAAARADAPAAIEAARASGRTLRRRARWVEADGWYGIALSVARASGLDALVARSLAGLGLVRRERGSLPEARRRFEQALAVAASAGDPDTLASIHHDLMGLEQLVGDPTTALRHGWRAVRGYASAEARVRCMTGIAAVLLDARDWAAAHDAYLLVLNQSEELYYRVYALDGLAFVAAMQGDAAGFDRWTGRSDAEGWASGPEAARAEILCHRGLACRALGRREHARRWLEDAVAFAEEHGFSRILFRAEAALHALDEADGAEEPPSSTAVAPPEVRDGLRAMRREVVGAAH